MGDTSPKWTPYATLCNIFPRNDGRTCGWLCPLFKLATIPLCDTIIVPPGPSKRLYHWVTQAIDEAEQQKYSRRSCSSGRFCRASICVRKQLSIETMQRGERGAEAGRADTCCTILHLNLRLKPPLDVMSAYSCTVTNDDYHGGTS